MKRSPVVTNTKNVRPVKKVSKGKKFLLFVNRLMPFILASLFVVTLFSIANLAGDFGKGWAGVFGGLLSNFGTYFIAVFMLFHSLMWYHDVNRRICRRRVICTLFTLFLASALQHIITAMNDYILTKGIRKKERMR